MSQGVFPKALYNKLIDFTLTFISDRFVDGVTYGLFFKNETDIIAKCDEIYSDTNDYFGELGVMRKIDLCNGVVYDIDMSVIKRILQEYLKSTQEKDLQLDEYAELIGNQPEQSRAEDMKRFAELCINEYRAGKKKIMVSLFNLTANPNTIVMGKDAKDVALFFQSFAIRQWDMENINKTYLIPHGIRVSSLEICDILPGRSGVRYGIHLSGA